VLVLVLLYVFGLPAGLIRTRRRHRSTAAPILGAVPTRGAAP
jgi:hypothetical protein